MGVVKGGLNNKLKKKIFFLKTLNLSRLQIACMIYQFFLVQAKTLRGILPYLKLEKRPGSKFGKRLNIFLNLIFFREKIVTIHQQSGSSSPHEMRFFST